MRLTLLLVALAAPGGWPAAQPPTDAAPDDRAWLGITILDMRPELAATLGMPQPIGVAVVEVGAGSAAERAGLRRGDVIVAMNGESIDEPGELSRLIERERAGARAAFDVWRDGRVHSIETPLDARPAALPVDPVVAALAAKGNKPRDGKAAGPAPPGAALDLRLRALTPAEARAMNIEFGLLVERIGPRAKAPQLARGDVVIGINNDTFASLDEFNALVAKAASGSSVALRVRRGMEVQYVAVQVVGQG